MNLMIFAEKRNFRGLIRQHPNLIVIPWALLMLNIFIPPPNVDLGNWLNVVVTMFASFDLRFAGISYILDAILEVCNKYNYTGLPGQIPPTMDDGLEYMNNKKHPPYSPSSNYRDSSRSRLSGLLNHTRKVFKCTYGILLNELWRHNVVIEFDGLYQDVKVFIITYMLYYEYMNRLANRDRINFNQTIIFTDEAQQIFRRTRETQEIPSLFDKIFMESRELKISFANNFQYARDASHNIVSNSSTKFATGFSDSRDLAEYFKIIGINDQEKMEYARKYLGPGTALVTTPKYPDSFIIKVPYIDLGGPVSDDEILKHLSEKGRNLYHEKERDIFDEVIRMMRGIPAESEGLLNPYQQNVNDKKDAAQSQPKKDKSDKDLERALKVLRYMLSRPHPFVSQKRLFQECGISSGSIQRKIKKTLVNNGLISEHYLQVGKTKVIFWEATNKALKILKINKGKIRSKGGYLHQACAYLIDKWALNQGYESKIEYFLTNNKPVDLVLTKDNRSIFIEICISEPYTKEIINIIKDFSTDLIPEKLILTCKNAKAKKALTKLVKEDIRTTKFRDRIEIAIIGDYIKEFI